LLGLLPFPSTASPAALPIFRRNGARGSLSVPSTAKSISRRCAAAFLGSPAGSGKPRAAQRAGRFALCLPKSLEAVQAIYGVHAAGAAYVPLQFDGPPARLAAILDSLEP